MECGRLVRTLTPGFLLWYDSPDVPVISAFFGILIRMYFDDHPPPHFHAEYRGQNALVDFDGRIIVGEIGSATARKLIRAWASQHRFELEANWKRAKKLQPLENIAPLE
jgi:hypothetical protein